jgi:hypothetical protein
LLLGTDFRCCWMMLGCSIFVGLMSAFKLLRVSWQIWSVYSLNNRQ